MFDFKHVESAELAKQLRERHAVDTLQRLYAAFPSGLIRRGAAGTEPDFIVESEKKQVGVEVVEYFRPDIHEGLPVKAQEIFTAESRSRANQVVFCGWSEERLSDAYLRL